MYKEFKEWREEKEKVPVAVVYTRDCHPPEHSSFLASGGDWPAHCVVGTSGYEFSPELLVAPNAIFIDKGTDKEKEAYSGFQGTDLASKLKGKGIERVLVSGLATDYCVMATAMDAKNEGLEVWLLTDAIAGVDLKPGDVKRAIQKMAGAGVQQSNTNDIVNIIESDPKPTALIVVDVQQDFCPGGRLAVAEAPKIFANLNALIQKIS
jgi:nicotinamidase/pyrazinamidase